MNVSTDESAMKTAFWKRNRLRVCVGLAAGALVLGSFSADAATYYVSQMAGSDSNAGTSSGAPWKNCPGMAAYAGSRTLQPGDIVYFDRSNTWPVSGSGGIFLTGGVTYIGDSWGSGTTRAHLQATNAMDSGVVAFSDHPTIPTIFQGFNVDANGQVT
ncbi:MAG: hypothetical protein JO279_03610, partial [Verrucomicrobia bacterium]|nr:hypothetical protein [Verrucomicrobiota bacterium]